MDRLRVGINAGNHILRGRRDEEPSTIEIRAKNSACRVKRPQHRYEYTRI